MALADPKPKRAVPAWWAPVQPWLSLVVRLALAVILARAAIPKLMDIQGSQQDVVGYDIFPWSLARLIGTVLPVVELILAILLVAGLLTRWAALVFGLMLVAFIAGMAQAWARGLNISCGCFSVGPLPAGEKPAFLQEILRDVGFLVLCAWAVIWPRSRFSADSLLGFDPVKATTDKTR
jgi:uncharacterized membrane protein YphA (DoxX/SURF4 family)